MSTRPKPQVLLVDDELHLLNSLMALLRREYDVRIATSGTDALKLLNEMNDLAVVVSDMRMPRMDGATFLHEVMHRRPDASRIMLTGEPGRDGAAQAVNKGQIFRFLMKPCVIEDLRSAIDAGVVQHRIVRAERAVLVETLIGCINALMELVAVVNPQAFTRAHRIRRLAMQCAERIGATGFWQLEMAALVSQIAPATGINDVTEKILEHLPRLEPVIQIVTALRWDEAALARLGEGTIGTGARILSAVIEYENQLAQGKSGEAIFIDMGRRSGKFGANVLLALEATVGEPATDDGVEIWMRDVVAGSTLLEELQHPNGAIIAPRLHVVGVDFVRRVGAMAPELMNRRIRVIPPAKNQDSGK